MKKLFSRKTIGQCLRFLSALFSYCGVVLFLFLALVRTESGFSKQTEYFIGLALWLLVAALLTSLFSQRIKGNLTVIDLFFALFFIYLTINHLFLSPVNASGKYLVLLLLGMNYCSLRIILPSYRNMIKFAAVIIVVCGLVEALAGIRQLIGISPSLHFRFAMTGTFFNPGPYGGYLSIAMSIALYYLIHYHQYFMRCIGWLRSHPIQTIQKPVTWLYPLCTLTFVLSFIIFFGVMSRAAMIALGISSLFIFWYKKSFKSSIIKSVKTHSKKMLLFAMLFLIIVGAAGIVFYSIKKNSANGRLFLWKMSCSLITKNPVTGSGFGTYSAAYVQVQADYFSKHPESKALEVADAPEYGFNEYLQLSAETGITGLVLFLMATGAALIRLIKKRDALAYGMISLAVFACFSYPFSLLPFQILLIIFLVAGAEPNEPTEGSSRTIVSNIRKIVTQQPKSVFCDQIRARIIGAIACFMAICLYALTAGTLSDKVAAQKEWKKGTHFYRINYYEAAAQDYAVLYPLLRDDFRFLFEYGHTLNKAEQYERSNHILREGCTLSSDPMFYNIIGNNYKALENISEAENAYQRAFEILPNRLYSLYLLMKLCIETDQPEKACEMARRIINFPPKIDSPAIRDMKWEAKRLLTN